MKHKNQLRWLAFLLIPFNILFAVHIIIPLQFISNNGSMLEYYAGEQQMSMYRYTTTSYVYFSRRTLNHLFQKYVFTLHTITNLLWSSLDNNSYIHYKNQHKTPVNAFQLSSEPPSLASNKMRYLNQSMWFSTGFSKQTQLPQSLAAQLEQYYKLDPYIRQLICADSRLSIDSFIYYAVENNSSIFFQYPAQSLPRFSNISAPILDDYYHQSINIYLANNKSLSMVPFIEYSTTGGSNLLVLCRPSINQNQSKVICLKIQANKFQYQIRSNFSPLNFSQLNFTYYLLMNPDFLPVGSKPVYIIFGNQQQSHSKVLSSTHFSDQAKVQAQPQYTIKPYQVLYYFQANFTVYFFAPITIDPFNRNSTQYFLVCVIQLDQSVVLNQKLAINFPQLLLPVTLLVIIASIVSTYIVKVILNSIEKQLYTLDHPCQLIVQGNLDVQISDYRGAKEIKQLYDKIKIINKIHRYSTQSFFTGHFSSKLLKYAEALQFIKQLGYDTANLLENMGEAYTHIEQWKKGREALKESINISLQLISKNYGSINDIIKIKRERKMPISYKQLELTLIRRLFKLNFNYLAYLQQRASFSKTKDNSAQQSQYQSVITDGQLNKQCLYYLKMLKKAFYPDFTAYSQCIIMLYYEAKQVAKLINYSTGKSAFQKIDKLLEVYTQEYFNNHKDKSRVNYKEKYVRQIHQLKRKPLSHYSKAHPDILKAFKNHFLFQINYIQRKDPRRFIPAVDALCQCLPAEFMSLRMNYLSLLYLRNTLIQLSIPTALLESTQVFRQIMPFSALYSSEPTEDSEHQRFKFPTKYSAGLEREFILVFDCGKNYVENDRKLMSFHDQRAEHLHQKLIKATDRVSIVKFNARRGVQVECKLLLKECSECLLRKSVKEVVRERSFSINLCPGIIEALVRCVERVKHLRSEKVIVFFFRTLQQYRQQIGRIHRSHKEKYSAVRSSVFLGEQSDEGLLQTQERCPQRFGEWTESLLQQEGVRNLKLILYCAKEDSRRELAAFFGLQDINPRIWSKSGGVNISNNLVYIIQDDYRNDIDRILMLKAQLIPDNHIFIF